MKYYNSMEFKDFAQQIAETAESVLKCDITIIDNDFIRIAGTGIFVKYVGKKVPNNNSFHIVIEKKQNCIVSATPFKSMPSDYLHITNRFLGESISILIPIILNGKALAAIGLSALSEEKMLHIINNYDTYAEFLKHISNLLHARLKSMIITREAELLKNYLTSIIDTYIEGIMCINTENKITFTNIILQQLLSESHMTIASKKYHDYIDCPELNKAIENKENKDSVYCTLKKGRQKIPILANVRVISNNGVHFGTVILLQETLSIKKKYVAIADRESHFGVNRIIGTSKVIEKIKHLIKTVADSRSSVMITGDSGTGKELCARAIHEESSRANKPFIAINCSAIPENLLESELFGYEDGTFTGGKKGGKKGKFEMAQGGVIFFDEIGDMPLTLQAKILRVLQEKSVTRLGSSTPIKLDVRVITATHKNILKLSDTGDFRKDLYYRINVIPIRMPSLMERTDDIILLATFFLDKHLCFTKKAIDGFTPHALRCLLSHNWPGNARELENVIEYAINMECSSLITVESLPESIKITSDEYKSIDLETDNDTSNLKQINQKLESENIRNLLMKYGNNTASKKKVAEELGIGIATLYRKIKKYNI